MHLYYYQLEFFTPINFPFQAYLRNINLDIPNFLYIARGLFVNKHLFRIRVLEESLGKVINCLYAIKRKFVGNDIFFIIAFKKIRRVSNEKYNIRLFLSFQSKYFI